MKSNIEILNDTAQGANKILIAMREAQIEILNEVLQRYNSSKKDYGIRDIIFDLKREL